MEEMLLSSDDLGFSRVNKTNIHINVMQVRKFENPRKVVKKSDWNYGWGDLEIIDVESPNHEHVVSTP